MREIFDEVAMLSGLAPFSFYIANRKKLGNIAYVVPLIVVIAVGAIYELIATKVFNVPTFLWFRTYSILEPIAFFYFFYKIFNGKYTLFLYFLGGIGLIMSLWLSIDYENTKGLEGDSYMSMYACVLVFLMSLLWFKDLFLNITSISILDIPAFYFIAGMILYLAGTIFTNILGDLIATMPNRKFADYWLAMVIMGLIFRIFLVLGICKALPK